MLPRPHRLTSGELFGTASRRGRRTGSATLVVHLRRADRPDPLQVGFVVGRSVGGAVVRNRVRRRLRHLVRDLLPELPATGVLVVRALPRAGTAGYAELRADLERCLDRAHRPPRPLHPDPA